MTRSGPHMSAHDAFVAWTGAAPTVTVRSPGRVNLIGEHTDYNDGFVLPMALPFETVLAASPIPTADHDDLIEITSVGYGTARFRVSDAPQDTVGWARYVHGMAVMLGEAGVPVLSWQGCLASDIPIGASLSSSAALEMASGLAMATLAGVTLTPSALARMGQRVENEIIGINSGIMDQLACAGSAAGHASLIDCRSLEVQPAPLPQGSAVVVMDTGTRRELVESEYDDRRRTCEAGAELLGVEALRDASLTQVATLTDALVRRRAHHVVSENERTLAAADAMRVGDAALVGRLMNASHASLRDDYEVSGPALNAIVEIAQATDGCLGARMTGGGFAGCAVALTVAEAAETFCESVAAAYTDLAMGDPALWICTPHAGASVL